MERWLAEGRGSGSWSERTIANRQLFLGNLAWWIEHVAKRPATLQVLSPELIREFLAYLREPAPQGRWGTDRLNTHPACKPSTVQTYHRHIRALLNFCQAEGLLRGNPLANVRAPRVPKDKIEPSQATRYGR
jgi:hypothetical protein